MVLLNGSVLGSVEHWRPSWYNKNSLLLSNEPIKTKTCINMQNNTRINWDIASKKQQQIHT